MKNQDKIEEACYFYVLLSVIYTLFSWQSREWTAFNYFLQYWFIATIVYYANPKAIISKLIICLSVARCITNIYALFNPEIIKINAVCIMIVISLIVFAIWTLIFPRFSQR